MHITKELSTNLNGFIRQITDEGKYKHLITTKSFNGSPIPFIGPNWEEVDFTKPYCHFAVVTHANGKPLGKKYIGFNESLEFEHYPYMTVVGFLWEKLITLIYIVYKECLRKDSSSSIINDALKAFYELLEEYSLTHEIIE